MHRSGCVPRTPCANLRTRRNGAQVRISGWTRNCIEIPTRGCRGRNYTAALHFKVHLAFPPAPARSPHSATELQHVRTNGEARSPVTPTRLVANQTAHASAAGLCQHMYVPEPEGANTKPRAQEQEHRRWDSSALRLHGEQEIPHAQVDPNPVHTWQVESSDAPSAMLPASEACSFLSRTNPHSRPGASQIPQGPPYGRGETDRKSSSPARRAWQGT